MAAVNTDSAALSGQQTVAELEKQLKTDKKALVPLAAAYIDNGRPADVIKLVSRFPGCDQDPAMRVYLAQAYFDSFQNDQAKKIIGSMGEQAGQNSLAQRLLGEMALDDNKTDTAHTYLRNAYNLDRYDRQTVALLRGLGEDIPKLPGEDDTVIGSIVPDRGPRESLPHALAEVGIAVVACGALFGLYKWRADVSYEAAALVMEARPNAGLGDVASMTRTIETYEQVLQLESGNQYALAGLAEAHALLYYEHGMLSHKDRAEKYLQICRKKGIEKAERYMAEGLLLLADNHYQDVKLLADALLKKGANDERILFLAGAAEKGLGNLDVGVAELKKAVDISSKTPLYTLTLADAYYLQGDERNAQFFWGKAGMMNPGHPVARSREMISQVAQGKDSADIQRHLDKIEKQIQDLNAPKDKAALCMAKAELALRDNDFAKAEAQIDQALEVSPADPFMLETRGRILLAAGEGRRGMANLTAAQAVYPDSRRIILDIVDAYLQDNDFDNALTALQKLAARDEDNNPDYHIKHGDILRLQALSSKEKRSELLEAAQGAYNRAVHINQSYAAAYYSLGLLMQQQHRTQDAAAYYEKAVQLKERYPEVYTQMAILFVNEMHDMASGNQWFEDAAKMYVTNKRTPVRTIVEFYKTAADTFAQAGAAGKKFEKNWRQKYEELNNK